MLAGLFGLLPDDAAPKGWEKWGLGRLVPAARERGWLVLQPDFVIWLARAWLAHENGHR
jgi:hypothetical protein